MTYSIGICAEYFPAPCLKRLWKENLRYLILSFRHRAHPLQAVCIKLIVFYQRHLSRHTCLFQPTCSEYTKRCIHNHGVILGIILGAFRILRCNPLSKGGFDPAPEKKRALRWLI